MVSQKKAPELLKTGIGNARNVLRYMFGDGKLSELEGLLKDKRSSKTDYVIYYVDQFFWYYDDFLNFFALDPLLDSRFIEGE